MIGGSHVATTDQRVSPEYGFRNDNHAIVAFMKFPIVQLRFGLRQSFRHVKPQGESRAAGNSRDSLRRRQIATGSGIKRSAVGIPRPFGSLTPGLNNLRSGAETGIG